MISRRENALTYMVILPIIISEANMIRLRQGPVLLNLLGLLLR